MLRNCLIITLIFLLQATGAAQRCGVTDTIRIDSFGTTSLTIPIDGYLTDDLSNPTQGLCNVSLYFRHSYVYGLTLTLVSPAGDSVQLVGPQSDQSRPPTALARWFVDFQDCAETPDPDPGAPGQWNNTAPFDWPAFGTFRGTYQPAGGCFTDLANGPVNGDWQLIIRNNRAGEQGVMTFLLLEFCDDGHEEGPCCFANAGELAVTPILTACANPADLPVPVIPRYRQPRPPTDQYGYAFAISRNDSILWIQDDPNLAGFPEGNYQVCGLSYRNGELPLIPTDGTFSPESLRDNLTGINPIACADLMADCRLVNLVPPPDTTFRSAQLCRGGFLRIGNQVLTDAGVYPIDFPGFAGCDSTVLLDLQVVDTLFVTLDTTICAEGVFMLGDTPLTTSGRYRDTLQSFFGCDSIVTANLSVAPPLLTVVDTAICGGESFMIGVESFATTGRFIRTIPAVNGCDSTVDLRLFLLAPAIEYEPFRPQLDCLSDTVFLDARPSNLEFADDFGWYDLNGNLLVSSLELTVTQPATYVFELTVGTNGQSCTVLDTVVITDQRFEPSANLTTLIPGDGARPPVQCLVDGAPCTDLTCQTPVLGINADLFPLRPGYDYAWTASPGGNVVSGQQQDLLFVDAPGTYFLEVIDTNSGCRLDTSFQLGIDTAGVSLATSGNQVLNCATSEFQLVADTLQSRHEDLLYEWSGGCLADPVLGPVLNVTCPGTYSLRITNQINGCSGDTSIVVAQNVDPVSLNLAPAAAPLSCRSLSRTLLPTAASGANGLRYEWRLAGEPTVIGTLRGITVSAPGTYTLTAIDTVNFCSAAQEILLAADTIPPTADAGPETVFLNCYALERTLGDTSIATTPELDYSWTDLNAGGPPLSTNSTLTVRPPGSVYELRVLDNGNGCFARDTVRVQVALDTPVIRMSQALDFDCFIDTVLLDASNTFLGFENEQSWTGPCLPFDTDRPVLPVFCPGTYVYSVLNVTTGCSASDSLVVGLANNGVVAILPDTAFLDCDTGEVTIDGNRSTDAPFVSWTRAGEPISLFGRSPTVTVPGRYELILSNFNGSCVDTASIEVVVDCPVLSIIVPPDSITCIRPRVDLDASFSEPADPANAVVEWLIPGGAVTQPGANDRELQVFSPGIFGFVITNLVSGEQDTSFVTVLRNQTEPDAEAGPRQTIDCYEPVVTLAGAGSSTGPLFSYEWRNSDNQLVGTQLAQEIAIPGTYFLQVTQVETGCQRVDNVTILDDTEAPTVTFAAEPIPCDSMDHSVALIPGGTDSYEYLWSGPGILGAASDSTVRVSVAGDYSARVTRIDNGCSVTEVLAVTQAPCPPFPSLADTSLTCRADGIVLRPTFRDGCADCSFRWQFNGTNLPGTNDSALLVNTVGNYTVVAVNRFGLRGSATAVVTDARFVPSGGAGQHQLLTCVIPEVMIGALELDGGFPYGFSWRDQQGNTIAGGDQRRVSVTEPGTYTLTVTNLFSACSATDEVVVEIDTISPIARAGLGQVLTCENKRKVLNGELSSLGREFRYQWTGGSGAACLEGANTLNPVVRCSGLYTIAVRDTSNGCLSIDTLTVITDDELPDIAPLPDTILNCSARAIELVGGDTTGAFIDYRWERTVDGMVEAVPEIAPATIGVTEAGSYRFRLTNTNSGCENEFLVEVTADFRVPTVDAGRQDTFLCGLDSILLTSQILENPDPALEYSWTSETGFGIGNRNGPRATVFQPDQYFVDVLNPINQCTSRDSVMLFRDLDAPEVFAGNDTTITCARPQVALSGSFTSVSGTGIISWTDIAGNPVGLPGLLAPVASTPGVYQLNITDPQNDCSGADIVTIGADTISPEALITTSDVPTFTCFRDELLLSAVESQGSRPVQFTWLLNGFTLAQTANLEIEESGLYTLEAFQRANGCRDTINLLVEEDLEPVPAVISPVADITCQRDSVLLEVENPVDGVVYRWLNSDEVSLAVGLNYTAGNTGVFQLTTERTRNGCRDTSAVRVREDFQAPNVRLPVPLPLDCERIITSVDATGSQIGSQFVPEWTSADGAVLTTTNPYVLPVTEPGDYNFSLLNLENGCIANRTVTVNQQAIPIDSLDISVTQPVCREVPTGQLVIEGVEGGQGPYSYSVNGGFRTDRLFYDKLPLGEYTVEVIGSDGCTTSRPFRIESAGAASLVLRQDTFIRLGDSVLLNFETSLPTWDATRWTVSGNPINDTTNAPIFVRPFRSSTYTLELTGPNGCVVTDDVLIEVDEEVNFYVPTAFSPNNDGRNDLLRPYVGQQVARILDFQIFDRWGEMLYDMARDPNTDAAEWGWDGQLGDRPLKPQAVAWRLKIELVDGTVLLHHGDAVIVR